jgi:hypothetical protein
LHRSIVIASWCGRKDNDDNDDNDNNQSDPSTLHFNLFIKELMKFNLREKVFPCVTTTLRVALQERFKYPSQPPLSKFQKNFSNSTDTSKLIEILISKLEQAAFNATFGLFKIDANVKSINPQNEQRLLRSYIGIIAQFIVHISPSFYSGRHSFTFRDMLLNNSLPEDIVNSGPDVVWPEIFTQGYLDRSQYRMILDMRDVEVNIATKGLNDLIQSCCGGGGVLGTSAPSTKTQNITKAMTCDAQGILDHLHNGGIFEEGSSFSRAQQYICFGEGQGCWKQTSNKVIVPCRANSSVCKKIPDDVKTRTFSEGDVDYFGLCVEYEDFLFAFARYDRNGEVTDPFIKGANMSEYAMNQIRIKWEKEIKMMRLYLDTNLTE